MADDRRLRFDLAQENYRRGGGEAVENLFETWGTTSSPTYQAQSDAAPDALRHANAYLGDLGLMGLSWLSGQMAGLSGAAADVADYFGVADLGRGGAPALARDLGAAATELPWVEFAALPQTALAFENRMGSKALDRLPVFLADEEGGIPLPKLLQFDDTGMNDFEYLQTLYDKAYTTGGLKPEDYQAAGDAMKAKLQEMYPGEEIQAPLTFAMDKGIYEPDVGFKAPNAGQMTVNADPGAVSAAKTANLSDMDWDDAKHAVLDFEDGKISATDLADIVSDKFGVPISPQFSTGVVHPELGNMTPISYLESKGYISYDANGKVVWKGKPGSGEPPLPTPEEAFTKWQNEGGSLDDLAASVAKEFGMELYPNSTILLKSKSGGAIHPFDLLEDMGYLDVSSTNKKTWLGPPQAGAPAKGMDWQSFANTVNQWEKAKLTSEGFADEVAKAFNLEADGMMIKDPDTGQKRHPIDWLTEKGFVKADDNGDIGWVGDPAAGDAPLTQTEWDQVGDALMNWDNALLDPNDLTKVVADKFGLERVPGKPWVKDPKTGEEMHAADYLTKNGYASVGPNGFEWHGKPDMTPAKAFENINKVYEKAKNNAAGLFSEYDLKGMLKAFADADPDLAVENSSLIDVTTGEKVSLQEYGKKHGYTADGGQWTYDPEVKAQYHVGEFLSGEPTDFIAMGDAIAELNPNWRTAPNGYEIIDANGVGHDPIMLLKAHGYLNNKGVWTGKPQGLTLAEMPYVGPKAGSAEGGVYKHGDQNVVVKSYDTPQHAENEILAANLYNIGTPGSAPEMVSVNLGDNFKGGTGVGSYEIKDLTPLDVNNPDHLRAAQAQFGQHVLLGNWDAIGLAYDNTFIRPDGKAVMVDPGGSLLYRAQGGEKGAAFAGDDISEVITMMDPNVNPQAAKVFGNMTPAQVRTNIKATVDNYATVDEHGVWTLKPEVKKAILSAYEDDMVGQSVLSRVQNRVREMAAYSGMGKDGLKTDLLEELTNQYNYVALNEGKGAFTDAQTLDARTELAEYVVDQIPGAQMDALGDVQYPGIDRPIDPTRAASLAGLDPQAHILWSDTEGLLKGYLATGGKAEYAGLMENIAWADPKLKLKTDGTPENWRLVDTKTGQELTALEWLDYNDVYAPDRGIDYNFGPNSVDTWRNGGRRAIKVKPEIQAAMEIDSLLRAGRGDEVTDEMFENLGEGFNSEGYQWLLANSDLDMSPEARRYRGEMMSNGERIVHSIDVASRKNEYPWDQFHSGRYAHISASPGWDTRFADSWQGYSHDFVDISQKRFDMRSPQSVKQFVSELNMPDDLKAEFSELAGQSFLATSTRKGNAGIYKKINELETRLVDEYSMGNISYDARVAGEKLLYAYHSSIQNPRDASTWSAMEDIYKEGIFQKHGYDAFEMMEGGIPTRGMSRNTIRHPDAMFDPRLRHLKDIRAGVIPMLPGVPALLRDEEEQRGIA